MMVAKFIGKDRSMGFRKGNLYRLKTCIGKKLIYAEDESGLFCYYSSIESFLKNWKVLDV